MTGQENSFFYDLYYIISNAYLLIYLVIFTVSYAVLKKRNPVISDKKSGLYIKLLLVAGLLARFALAPVIDGFSVDMGCFRYWAYEVAKDFTGFYNGDFFVDYPPLYIYVLYAIGKLQSIAWPYVVEVCLVKLPSMLADIVISYMIYRVSKKSLHSALSLLLAGAYLFNPLVLLDSTVWGQVDAFLTVLIVAALLLVSKRRYNSSSAVFSASLLMKPQALFFIPVLLLELIKRRKIVYFITAFLSALVVAILVIIPFSRDPLWIFKLYLNTAGGYEYASMNAFNLFALLGGNLVEDASTLIIFSYKIWGFIFDAAVFIFAAIIYIKSRHNSSPFVTALFLNTAIFMVSSRMHERYMFPSIALALLAFIYLKDRRMLYIFGAFTATNFLNTNNVLYRMLKFEYPHVPGNDPLLLIVSGLNVIIFAYLVKVIVDTQLRGRVISNMHKK